jgi:hypothetical protein
VSDGFETSSDPVVVTVADTTIPTLNLPADQTLEATGASGVVATFAATATDTVDQDVTIACSPASGDTFPLGSTPVNCTATDDAGNQSTGSFVTCTATDDAGNVTSRAFSMTVRDTTAPSLSTVTPSTAMLWPPNHKMVDVDLRYTATDPVSAAACRVAVASNEPANGAGDGNTASDWQVLSPTHVQLRAERAGGGSGRIYTLTVTCTDAGGNAAINTATVTVPKSMGR